MIICPTHRFLLVHIPKCAGTSVRLQLRDCDPEHIFLGRTGEHPELGLIDYAHIPLRHLRAHFPDEYAWFDRCDSFAILRDPLDRFGSAMRQVLWQYEQRPMTLIPQDELRDLTLRTLDELAPVIDNPPHRFIFFTRQSDYVFDEGTRRIDHLVPMDMAGDLIGYFARRSGVALDEGRRSNQNVDLRVKGGVGRLAYGLNATLRRALPAGLHTRIKGAALKVLAKPQNAAESAGLLDIPDVQDFVTEHYAEDAVLFAEVAALRVTLKTALAEGTLSSKAADA